MGLLDLKQEKYEVLDEIYKIEVNILVKNDFSNLFITVPELLSECQKNINKSLGLPSLVEYLNQLWLEGLIICFFYESDKKPEDFESSLVESESFHRKILVSKEIEKVRSRNAEIIRLSFFNRNRFDLQKSIATISYIKDYKKIPRREITANQIIQELNYDIENGIESGKYFVPIDNRTSLQKAIRITMEGFNLYSKLEMGEESFNFSKFQYEAIKKILYAKYFNQDSKGNKLNYPKSHFLITAGVGSGKTYAFLTGILIEILFTQEKHSHNDGVNALILYPRITLVQDQYNNADKIISYINQISSAELSGFKINILMEAAGKVKAIARETLRTAVPNISAALEACYSSLRPNIVFGTLETIKRRIVNPICSKLLIADLKSIVYDEIHLLDGLQGTHAIYFSSRLLQLKNKYNKNQDFLNFIGSSATIAEPQEFSSKIFGNIDPKQIEIINPLEDDLEICGINHHVLLKALRGTHLMSALTNLTSLVIHNRRNGLQYEFQKDIKTIEKTLGFADSLNVIGRWSFLVKDNEEMNLNSAFKGKPIPYFSKFFEPLRNLGNRLNKNTEIFENICLNCKRGIIQKISWPSDLEYTDFASLKHTRRTSTNKSEEKDVIPDLLDFLENEKPKVLGSLNYCPYFIFGCCWWFSQDSAKLINHEDCLNLRVFPSIRHRTITSGTDLSDDDRIIDIQDYFRDFNKNQFLHTFQKSLSKISSKYSFNLIELAEFIQRTKSKLTLLLASPKIEVGVDFKLVKEGIGHKAIRNLASYQQKMGRVGREKGSDSLLVNLISFRPLDHHYFRNNFKLIDNSYIEPVSLKEINLNIIKSELFMAIFDYIAAEESIPNHGNRLFLMTTQEPPLQNKIEGIIQFFEKAPDAQHQRSLLQNYLKKIYPLEVSIVNETISEFMKMMLLMNMNISLLYPVTCIAEAINKKSSLSILQGGQNEGPRILDAFNSFIENLRKIVYYKDIFEKFNLIEHFENFDLLNKILFKSRDFLDFKNKFKLIKDSLYNLNKFIDTIEKQLDEEENNWSTDDATTSAACPIIIPKECQNPNFRINLGKCHEIITLLENNLRQFGMYIRKSIQGTDRTDSQQEQIFSIITQLYSFFDEFEVIVNSTHKHLKLAYFSDLFTNFTNFRDFYPFIFPQVLFESPTSKPTTLKITSNQKLISITISDVSHVLYEILPGSWNYRFGRLRKSPTKGIFKNEDLYYICLDNLEQEYDKFQYKFQRISLIKQENLPGDFPLFLKNQLVTSEVQVLKPQNVVLINSSENCFANIRTNLVKDDDEEQREKPDRNFHRRLSTMPTTRPINWYDVEFGISRVFKCNIETQSPAVSIPKIQGRIIAKLPKIISSIFNKISITNQFEVTKYIWSVNRTYSNKELNPINYYFTINLKSPRIAFLGDHIKTDGLIFQVNKELFFEFWQKILIQKGSNQEFRSLYSQILIQSLSWLINQVLKTNPFDGNVGLMMILLKYVKEKQSLIVDLDSLKEIIDTLNEAEINILVEDLTKFGHIIKNADIFPALIKDLQDLIQNKILMDDDFVFSRAFDLYLHTLSHFLLTASLMFSGVEDQSLHYFYDVKKSEIYLFDAVELGNGTCETLFKYLYIPDIQRQLENLNRKNYSKYPSGDLCSELEILFQECSYFQAGKISFDLSSFPISDVKDLIIPKEFENILPDLKLNYKNGFIDIIKSIKNQFPDFSYGDLYLVQKIPGYFKDLINYQETIEKFESIIDVCVVACTECLIDTFNCIYGYIGAAERLNKLLFTSFYLDFIEKDPSHYSILENSPDTFFATKLLGKEENSKQNPINYKFINQEGETQERIIRILKTEKFKEPLYHNKGYCEQKPADNKVNVRGFSIEKYEGANIEEIEK